MKNNYKTLLISFLLLVSTSAFSVPKLNSYPSATATIFLDFDGHTVVGTIWNGGNAIYCQPAPLTDAQILEAFNRVSEDYRPFNINITTDSLVYLAAPLNRRNRIIITPTSAWAPGVGGIAAGGSFAQNSDIPAFVFSDRLGPNSPKMIGECCSHESGHTLGLQHQSKFDVADCVYPSQEYYLGEGLGEAAWSPIMGNSYYRNMTTWNNGPMPSGCTDLQDNLSILTTQNGFGYRTDDYTEALNATATLLVGNNYTKDGIITTTADKDAFKFILAQNATIHATAIPFNIGLNYNAANLDIKLELFNSSGTLVRSYDPLATMAVTVDTVLNAGTYYWRVDGTGNLNVGDYGSIGAYTLSGTSSALPIHSVTLTGKVEKNQHSLNWNIVADEAIKNIVIETSQNAVSFNTLSNVNATTNKFLYNPYQDNTVYYRLKVTSVLNQTVFSNTIALKSTEKTADKFTVSTLVQDEIRINAFENFTYKISDVNGRQIAMGNGQRGMNNINVSNKAKGMYIIQLYANNITQTEKIIKN